MRTVTISGKVWTVAFAEEFRGLCVQRDTIILHRDEHTSPKDWVDTVIHEVLHAQFPEFPEKLIAQLAGELASALAVADALPARISSGRLKRRRPARRSARGNRRA